jgi:hypothetical protein
VTLQLFRRNVNPSKIQSIRLLGDEAGRICLLVGLYRIDSIGHLNCVDKNCQVLGGSERFARSTWSLFYLSYIHFRDRYAFEVRGLGEIVRGHLGKPARA